MNEVANETIQKLGMVIGQDLAVSTTTWERLWVVFKFNGEDVEEFGRLTLKNDEPGFLLDGDEPGDLAMRLRDVMLDEDGKLWIACKVSIVRETRDINIKFEYEDESRWDEPLPF